MNTLFRSITALSLLALSMPAAAQSPSPPGAPPAASAQIPAAAPGDGIVVDRGQVYLMRNGRAVLINKEIVPDGNVLTWEGRLVPLPSNYSIYDKAATQPDGIMVLGGRSYVMRQGRAALINATVVPEGQVLTAQGRLTPLPADFSGFTREGSTTGAREPLRAEPGQTLSGQAGVPQVQQGSSSQPRNSTTGGNGGMVGPNGNGTGRGSSRGVRPNDSVPNADGAVTTVVTPDGSTTRGLPAVNNGKVNGTGVNNGVGTQGVNGTINGGVQGTNGNINGGAQGINRRTVGGTMGTTAGRTNADVIGTAGGTGGTAGANGTAAATTNGSTAAGTTGAATGTTSSNIGVPPVTTAGGTTANTAGGLPATAAGGAQATTAGGATANTAGGVPATTAGGMTAKTAGGVPATTAGGSTAAGTNGGRTAPAGNTNGGRTAPGGSGGGGR